MQKMREADLSQSVLDYLSNKQADIDDKDNYPDMVDRGKALWKSKSTAQFKKIRLKLETLCVGKRRCNYCEDSVADEVEHIKPKDLYPSLVFSWNNYLFSCGNCNGPKSNRFAVFDGTEVVEISRKRGAPVVPPRVGDDVFLNPRVDDPMDYLVLDLVTMNFIPKPGIPEVDRKRAKYTIGVLKLNSRDFLIEARKEALSCYKDSLEVYVQKKNDGADASALRKKHQEIETRQHPTVWAEVKRQRNRYPEIDNLFTLAPELLGNAS